MYHQTPLPVPTALRALARCVATTAVLLARRRIHLPRGARGHAPAVRRRHARPGSTGRRSSTGRRRATRACWWSSSGCARCAAGVTPCSAAESLLNTPLFVGFPGFVSKLWLAHDEHGVYRGLYEWDGPARGRGTTRAPSGGCSRWCACRARSTTACCPGLRRDDAAARCPHAARRPSAPARRGGVVAAGRRSHDAAAGRPRGRRRSDRTDARPAGPRPRRRGPRRGAAAEAFRPVPGADHAPADAGGAAPARRGRRAAGPGRHRARAPGCTWARAWSRSALAELALPDTAFPHLTLLRQMDVEAVLGARARRPRGRRSSAAPSWSGSTTATAGARADPALAGRDRDGDLRLGRRLRRRRQHRAPARAGIGWRGGGYRQEVVLADVELDGDLAPRASRTSLPGAGPAVRVRPRRARDLAAAGHPARGPTRGCRSASPVHRSRPSELQRLLDDAGLARPDRRGRRGRARVPLQHRLRRPVPRGRLFLAGDAAHAHSPAGGQGMNTGHPGRGQPRLEARLRRRERAARRAARLLRRASGARWRATCSRSPTWCSGPRPRPTRSRRSSAARSPRSAAPALPCPPPAAAWSPRPSGCCPSCA